MFFWVEHSIQRLPGDLVARKFNVLLPCVRVCEWEFFQLQRNLLMWPHKKKTYRLLCYFFKKKKRLISFPYAICFQTEKGLLVFFVSFEVMVYFAVIDTFKIWIFRFEHIFTLFSHAFNASTVSRNLNFFHIFYI